MLIERNIREKVVAPDFRYPMEDGRLALARLCALQGRLAEARDWFAKAREVLDAHAARPLRAICDYDEALALVRHSIKTGTPLDRQKAMRLLREATSQFEAVGMPGWLIRAHELTAEIG